MTDPRSAPLPVVAVHGVGCHDPRRTPAEVCAAYSADWARDLAAGLGTDPDRFDVAMAYYAPHLTRRQAAQGDDGDDGDDDWQDPLEARLYADWLAELGAPAAVAQGALTLPLRHTAGWVAEKFSLNGRLTRLFVRVFFREVAAYLRTPDGPARANAREEVASRIRDHRPTVVVAHSLGTVVTYEALHAHPELKVELLITLGSPLALPGAVFERLLPGPLADRGTRPPNVARWVNIADPGDPVAIPPLLARAFDGIALDLTDTIHSGFGFHYARNYLRCPGVAATLAPYLGR
ncbi:serine peptidase [Peterkaempfera bronchialis]|uniref:serine peptidase n=1 Tax=Peterkaempfera bronchialis TaxID=2126346 RepID=UPI003C2D153B